MSKTALTLLTTFLVMSCASNQGEPSSADDDVTSTGDRSSDETPEEMVSEDVTFTSRDDRRVHGTLTRLDGASRRPAILVIAGSGPTDRNWESPMLAGNNGSGRLLAEAVSRAGYVCLRYDKIATGQVEDVEAITWDAYEAEQLAALEFLLGHPAVEAERIFILGHSMGGVHALRLFSRLPAGQRSSISGLVLLSTPSRTMRDLIYAQLEEQYTQAGVEGVDLVAVLSPVGAALDAIIGELEPDFNAIQAPPVRQLIQSLANPISISFAREILVFNPSEHIASISVPLFIVGADRDLQVPVASAERLAEAARSRGNDDVTLYVAREADHVFKHEPTPFEEINRVTIQAHYNAEGRQLEPRFVEVLLSWLESHSS